MPPTFCIQYPFQWGASTFDAGEAFAMMAASFVALVEVWLAALRKKIKYSSTLMLYVCLYGDIIMISLTGYPLCL